MLGTAGLILALASAIRVVLAIDNGLSRTPAMGWNNWNSLGCDVSESLLLDTSAKLVGLGLRDVGYNYVVLDDCWSDGRDEKGFVKVDLQKFPHGMKWIAEQIHSQNLLYGMYSSAGELTCARYEGSLDHEVEDATSWASWDVDYLKYDNCYSLGRVGTGKISFDRYNTMAKALNATGRPILYSLCNWGEDFVMSWGGSIANSYRISGDIYDHFDRPDDLCSCQNYDPSSPFCVAPGSHCSVMAIINRVATYVDRGQPGGWQDLDMLEVGHGGMSDDEYLAHFSIWAAVKSPLLIGADIRELSPEALSILNNPAMIAISQDPVGRPAKRVFRDLDVPKNRWGGGEINVWSGPLSGGDQVVVLLNAANKDHKITAYAEDIFVSDGPNCHAPHCSQTWNVHDVWANRMDKAVAQRIINGEDAAKVYTSINWFNATTTSYSEGLAAGDERLLGTKVTEMKPRGSITMSVPKHGVKVLRLRSQSATKAKRYGISKEEL